MAAPSSAHTMPSQSATTAPISHPSIAWGPFIFASRTGMVMNGPTPIISSMFALMAPGSPMARSSSGRDIGFSLAPHGAATVRERGPSSDRQALAPLRSRLYLCPVDLVQQCAQTLALRRVNHLDERDTTREMGAKVGVPVAILTFRTKPNAVGENGFQTIEIGSADIQAFVGDQSRQLLSHTSAHDARLPVIHVESFLQQNRGRVQRETPGATFEILVARECQIVRVPGVVRP